MTAQEIQQQMAAVRRHMNDDLHEIRDSSGTMLDWRYYFRQYPWPMMGAAAAIGYFVVPRQVRVVRPDAKELAKLAKEERLIVQQKADTKPEKGLAAVAFGLLANALFRAGTAYLGQQAGKMFGQQAAQSNGADRGPYPH